MLKKMLDFTRKHELFSIAYNDCGDDNDDDNDNDNNDDTISF